MLIRSDEMNITEKISKINKKLNINAVYIRNTTYLKGKYPDLNKNQKSIVCLQACLCVLYAATNPTGPIIAHPGCYTANSPGSDIGSGPDLHCIICKFSVGYGM